MHARVTTFHVPPEKLKEARTRSTEAKSQAAAIPGLYEWFVAAHDDGQCIAVALYHGKEAADAALPHAKAMLSRFADLMCSTPQPSSYEVYVHEQGPPHKAAP